MTTIDVNTKSALVCSSLGVGVLGFVSDPLHVIPLSIGLLTIATTQNETGDEEDV